MTATLMANRWTLTVLSLLVFLFKSANAEGSSSYLISDSGRFRELDSDIALYGDAKVVDGGKAVQLTSPAAFSAGRVMWKKPIKLVDGKPEKSVSFSTNFSFSVSPANGDGLAFVMVPTGFNASVFTACPLGLDIEPGRRKLEVVAVKFKTLRDYAKSSGLVKIFVGGSASENASSASSRNLNLNPAEKVFVCINYEVGSRRLEVRASGDGEFRPSGPLISLPVDFRRLWKSGRVYAGLASSNGNASQRCVVYSWSFKLHRIPNWVHSQPLDPKMDEVEGVGVRERNHCAMRVLAALIFGTGCGALVSFVVLFFRKLFAKRPPVVPEEYAVQPVGLNQRKKVGEGLSRAIEDGKEADA